MPCNVVWCDRYTGEDCGITWCPAHLPRNTSNTIDVNTIITGDTKNDSVAVVRCKDCKYNYGIANNCEYAKDDIVCCYWKSGGLHSDDFCSKGERKETDE